MVDEHLLVHLLDILDSFLLVLITVHCVHGPLLSDELLGPGGVGEPLHAPHLEVHGGGAVLHNGFEPDRLRLEVQGLRSVVEFWLLQAHLQYQT